MVNPRQTIKLPSSPWDEPFQGTGQYWPMRDALGCRIQLQRACRDTAREGMPISLIFAYEGSLKGSLQGVVGWRAARSRTPPRYSGERMNKRACSDDQRCSAAACVDVVGLPVHTRSACNAPTSRGAMPEKWSKGSNGRWSVINCCA
jgi:hypothetical protein